MSSFATAPAVDRYLGRLRARAALFLVARAAVAGTGAAACALALGAWGAGPLAPTWVIGGVWAIAIASSVSAAAVSMRPLRALSGGGAARLLEGTRGDLVSPLRTAFELARGGGGRGSSDALVEAHAKKLRGELARLPPSRVVPSSWLRHWSIAIGLGLVAVALIMIAVLDRAAGGAYALMHPGARDAEGAQIAAAFDDVQARLVFPGYLDRPATVLADPTRIEIPPGTTVEMSGRARIDAAAAELEVAGATVRMEREGERWVARFLVRGDGPLGMRLRGPDGAWVRDATARSVHLVPDETPTVALLLPAEDEIVDGDDMIAILYEASDDIGIVGVDLVIRGADGREQRRRIATPEGPQVAMRGDETITLAELGAQPGDRIEIRVEARDGDDVDGPHIGRSETRTLTLASESTRRQESIEELTALVDRAIHTLADRLDAPAPPEEPAARARFESLRGSTEALLSSLDAFAAQAREGAVRRSDVVLYGEASTRIRRLLFEEQRAHGAPLAALPARERVDGRAVEELENDVLLLADLLTRARIDDAAGIARELESLRREIASLLGELRRADTPEARAAVLAAIARAEQRLNDLRARMGQMGSSVPEEFANAQEREAQATQEALSAMREAIERGDLDAAQQQLTRLEQQIDALARSLGSTEESFGEERFGPRERALAEALDRLMGLEAEQRELARRTGELRGAAARRALESTSAESEEAARRLAGRARAVREALSPIERQGLSSLDRESLDAVEQRLRDTEDALSTGDLGEASRMVESAEEQLDGLARDLELDSMMFPGHAGQTARSARAAQEAGRRMRDLRADLDDTLPDLGEHLAGPERGQMQGDAPRQRTARGAAGALSQFFEQGPDGTPLSPEIASGLGDVGRMMDDGTRGLERGDPTGAARSQEEAARRLTELREQVEQDMQQSEGGGGGGGQDGAQQPDFRRDVHIHEADEFSGPMEMRRRLLDAMHEAPPTGYEESVQRYYEGLLR